MLVLAGLLLEEIPPEIGQLRELQELELCYNMLTNLPDELANLDKLSMLKVYGKLPDLLFIVSFALLVIGQIFIISLGTNLSEGKNIFNEHYKVYCSDTFGL